jgi:hypothetical protein
VCLLYSELSLFVTKYLNLMVHLGLQVLFPLKVNDKPGNHGEVLDFRQVNSLIAPGAMG